VKTYRCQEVQEEFFFDCLKLKLEAQHPSKMLVILYWLALPNIPEDLNLFSSAVRTSNVA